MPIPFELQYFYKEEIASFAGDTSWHDVLTSCYPMSYPPESIRIILDVKSAVKTFDDDKVDLLELCSGILNYSQGASSSQALRRSILPSS